RTYYIRKVCFTMNVLHMDVMHDENGKVYFPASDFYKAFIREQLFNAVERGEEYFLETQQWLQDSFIRSSIIPKMEIPFVKEAYLVTTISYDKMKELSDSYKSEGQEEN